MQDDQLPELIDGLQIGVRKQIDLHRVVLDPPNGGQIVVPPQCSEHIARSQVHLREPVGRNPNPHRRSPSSLNAYALDPRYGRQLRLDRASQVIGKLGNIPLTRRETQVKRRIRSIRTLDFYNARFGLGWQLAPHLLQPRIDLREPLGRIVVELESNRDLTRSGNALGLDVVDPADRRNRLLDRCGQKPANRLGAGADVNRRDDDRGAFKLRELLDRQRLHRSHPQKHNHQVHDDRKYRVANKDIGDGFHRGA